MRTQLSFFGITLLSLLAYALPVSAATSTELVNALDIPPELVISHELTVGTGDSWPPDIAIDNATAATEAFPEGRYILLSNGLASDKGLGNTDWGNDGQRDFTSFYINLNVPSGAKSLVFRTRFTSIEYTPGASAAHDDNAFLQISWTPCNGDGCITAPVNLIKVSDIPDQKSPAILRSIDVAAFEKVGISFIVSDNNNGSFDSALELIDLHFSTEESPGLGLLSEELPPEDVKLAAGTARYEKSLLFVPGIGLPLDFRIFYNSKQTWSNTFSRKWSHSYEWSLEELENGLLHIRGGDGGSIYFIEEGSGTYTNSNTTVVGSFATSWNGLSGSVVKKSDGSYAYTDREQKLYKFTSSGLLTSITDSNENSLILSYDGGKKLDMIEDTRGGKLALNYQDGLLVSLNYTDSGAITHTISMSYLKTSETIDSQLYDYFDLVSLCDLNGDKTKFTYDDKGNMLTGVDPDGIFFVNNTYGGETVVAQIDAEGSIDTFQYFTDSLIQTNRLGLNYTTIYDIQDRPIRKIDPQGYMRDYTYDTNGNLLRETDPLGYITTMAYDENGNQISYTDPLGNTTSQTYNSQNRLTSVTDPAGYKTVYMYDDSGNLLLETDPLGHSLQYQIHQTGQILSTTNQRGHKTAYTYSLFGDLVREIDPFGNQVQYSYNGLGQMVSLTDERGYTSYFAYDEIGQLLSITDPLGSVTSRTYNEKGKILTLVEANGAITNYQYDGNGKMIKLIDPLGSEFISNYDSMEQLIGMTDPLGRSTSYNYDFSGQLVRATDALGNTIEATYDAGGRRTSIVDLNGNETFYEYDALGNLLKEIDPLGNSFESSYDSRGLLVSAVNAKKETISYTYNSSGQRVQSHYPSYSVTYTLDENGNRIGSVGEKNAAISADFDPLDRLVSRTDQFGNTIQYQYDPAGNLTELTYSDGKKVTYKYDSISRLISVTDWNNDTTSYTYDVIGKLLTVSHPDGSTVTNTYDLTGQMISTITLASDGSTIFAANYQYNKAGLLVSTETTLPLEPVIDAETDRFSYDSANQIKEMNGQAFSYDANGNLTIGLIGKVQKKMQYDELGRLVAVGDDTYEYDADGLRIRSTIAGETVRYVQDPNAPYSRILEEQDESGTIISRYVYGVGLISREESTGERRFYHYDSRGSTIALTGEDGLTTDRYVYDPYGKLIDMTGDTSNRFTYNGRDGVIDDGNGLYFMRSRYYDPTLMRFIQKDASFNGNIMDPQSLNRHSYARGNPVQFVDPDGDLILTTILIGAAIGVGTEIALDWATGDLSGGWNAYWKANKTDIILAGVLGGAGFGVFDKTAKGIKTLYKLKRMKKIKDFYKKAGMSMKAFKKMKTVNTIVKYGSRGAGLMASLGTIVFNKLSEDFIGTSTIWLYTTGTEGIGEGFDAAGDYIKEKEENLVEGVEKGWKSAKKSAKKVKNFIKNIF